MRTTLLILSILLQAAVGQAATVTGLLQPSSGTNRVVAVQILPTSTPQVVGSNFVFSINQTVRTDTNGAFSIQMLQGNYQLVIAGKDAVNIVVPDSTNSYNFIDIIDPALTNYVYRTPGALVRVSTNDRTWGFLNEKLTNGTSIVFSELNDGTNEVLEVSLAPAVQTAIDAKLPLTGGTLTGSLTGTTVTAGAIRQTQGALTHAGTVILDLATNTVGSLSLTGAVTFATTNLGVGRLYRLLVAATATNDALTFPGWRFVGPKPTEIAGAKLGLLQLEAWGSDDTNVVARYLEEP